MTSTNYYPAYLLNDDIYTDFLTALRARGIEGELARQLASRAQSACEPLVLPSDDSRGAECLLLLVNEGSRVRAWITRREWAAKTEAEACSAAAGKGVHSASLSASSWAVYRITQQ
jgi:hypothetical protein